MIPQKEILLEEICILQFLSEESFSLSWSELRSEPLVGKWRNLKCEWVRLKVILDLERVVKVVDPQWYKFDGEVKSAGGKKVGWVEKIVDAAIVAAVGVKKALKVKLVNLVRLVNYVMKSVMKMKVMKLKNYHQMVVLANVKGDSNKMV